MEVIDCVVAGAGVVGLAAARALALAGRDVIVLEAESAIGTQTSSRNSEVIHAGIYYEPGSVMARSCVQGKQALYRYCREHQVPFRQCEKLIVATSAHELPRLTAIKERAEANGVLDMIILTGAEARTLEPDLHCHAALLSPSTGIIDSHAYMLSLQGELEAAGGMIAFNSPVGSARIVDDGLVIRTLGADPMQVKCRTFVNAAGLFATRLAEMIDGLPKDTVPGTWYAKGNYFTLQGRSPFSRLIYPVPVAGGLGVHLTLDLGGQARFGPDVEWIDRLDYTVDPTRGAAFYDAVRLYWPGLKDGALQAGYAGVRPKISPPDGPKQDFRIDGPRQHGVNGLINLFGIESPGLTASLALADIVVAATN
jgi:L-2-hydroxyglutarate oxidase LhgO